jgi:hypothetical protein
MSGAAAKQAAAGDGAYAELTAAAFSTLPKNTLLTISEDLSPSCFSFRSHPTFRTTAGGDALKRVMGAYLARNPAGYFRCVQSTHGWCVAGGAGGGRGCQQRVVGSPL